MWEDVVFFVETFVAISYRVTVVAWAVVHEQDFYPLYDHLIVQPVQILHEFRGGHLLHQIQSLNESLF